MGDAADAFVAWAIAGALPTAALALVALAVDRVLARRGAAEFRLALWLAVALRVLLPLSATSPAALAPPTGDAAAPAWLDTRIAFAVWIAGALAATAAAFRDASRSARLARGAAPPARILEQARVAAEALGLSRVPRIVISPDAPTAFVRGLLSPTVVLPAGLSRDDADAMIVHELAHVRRGDLVVDAALAGVAVVAWFHPAAWIARRRVAHLREICCDATALAALGPCAESYRAALRRAARRAAGPALAAPAFLGGPSQIVARLAAAEGPLPARPALRTSLALAAALTACAATLPASPLTRGDAARRLIASAARGESRPGCIRLHYAAMGLAAESR